MEFYRVVIGHSANQLPLWYLETVVEAVFTGFTNDVSGQ